MNYVCVYFFGYLKIVAKFAIKNSSQTIMNLQYVNIFCMQLPPPQSSTTTPSTTVPDVSRQARKERDVAKQLLSVSFALSGDHS